MHSAMRQWTAWVLTWRGEPGAEYATRHLVGAHGLCCSMKQLRLHQAEANVGREGDAREGWLVRVRLLSPARLAGGIRKVWSCRTGRACPNLSPCKEPAFLG